MEEKDIILKVQNILISSLKISLQSAQLPHYCSVFDSLIVAKQELLTSNGQKSLSTKRNEIVKVIKLVIKKFL